MPHKHCIDSYPALIWNGERSRKLIADFAHPEFNHVILYIPGSDIWLECTSHLFIPGYIGVSNSGRPVLLITEQGGVVAQTPALTSSCNLESATTIVQLSESGEALISKEIEAGGMSYEHFRQLKTQAGPKSIREWLQYGAAYPIKQVDRFNIEVSSEKVQATVDYQLQSKELASRSGSRLFLPADKLYSGYSVPPANEKRVHAVDQHLGFIDTDTLFIMLPEGFAVESNTLEPVSLETPYGSFQQKLEVSEKSISIYRRFELRRCIIPAQDYGAYRDFFKEVAALNEGQLILSRK